MTTTAETMTGEQIVELCRRHTLFEWSAQAAVDPIPVARAKGIYFWTPEGKRFIDFNSQLMCVNIGHGDERVIRAIQEQAATLAYANPFMATEVRARLGVKLAEITPGDIDAFFFTNGGAEANENAIRIARHVYRASQDWRALSLVSRRHRRRSDADRRSAPLGGRAGHSRRLSHSRFLPRHSERSDTTEEVLARTEEVLELEGAADGRGDNCRARRRDQWNPDSARWLHAGAARAVRQVRHPSDRRRSDGRLWPHRRMVLSRPLEGRARSDLDGQRV